MPGRKRPTTDATPGYENTIVTNMTGAGKVLQVGPQDFIKVRFEIEGHDAPKPRKAATSMASALKGPFHIAVPKQAGEYKVDVLSSEPDKAMTVRIIVVNPLTANPEPLDLEESADFNFAIADRAIDASLL